MEFKDKCVIVTGSARGIGKEIALKFGSEGANVVVCDIDIEGQDAVAQSVCDEIKAAGGDAAYVLGDVSKPENTDNIIKFAKDKFGRIDVIVNNAGITRDNLIMRMSEADWDAVLTVNLKGAFNMIKSATRTMMKQRFGCFINMASVSGVMGNAGQANYSASKAGLIQTAMTDKLPEDVRKSYMAAIPLGKFGQVEDIANLALFLASDRAKYITGQVINVDGGLVM